MDCPERSGAERGPELRLQEFGPPRVHDRDRFIVLVGAGLGDVFVGQIAPVTAFCRPAFEVCDRLLQLCAGRGPKHLPDDRPQLDDADVFGGSFVHRRDQFRLVHLAPAGQVRLDVCFDQLAPEGRAVGVVVIGGRPPGRLLVVPGHEHRRVDRVGVCCERHEALGVQFRFKALPVEFTRAEDREVG